MALKSTSYLRSMLGRLRGSATYATSSTTPKLQAHAPTADFVYINDLQHSKKKIEGDFVPVYVALGMIFLSASLGLYTGMHHLMYSPSVRMRKKLRETLPEIYLPDKVVDEADKFRNKSLYRKVAHVKRV